MIGMFALEIQRCAVKSMLTHMLSLREQLTDCSLITSSRAKVISLLGQEILHWPHSLLALTLSQRARSSISIYSLSISIALLSACNLVS